VGTSKEDDSDTMSFMSLSRTSEPFLTLTSVSSASYDRERIKFWRLTVSDAFSVPMLKSAPEKSIFINHVPRLHPKVISIREQNSVPEVGVLVYTVSRLSNSQG